MDRHGWDRRYEEAERLWSAEPNSILVEEVADLVPGRALDLGTGEGRNAVWLAEQGWQVAAVDFSQVAISRARGLAEARGVRVHWVVSDLLDYRPQPASFDLVVIMYVHMSPTDRRVVLRRAAGSLASDGVVLVVGHDRSNLTEGHGGPRDPSVLFTPEEIVRELTGLRVERADRVPRSVEVDGGSVTAIAALVRARKAP